MDTITHLNGQSMKSIFSNQELFAGSHRIPIELADFPNGTYFIQIKTTSGNEVVKKIIKAE